MTEERDAKINIANTKVMICERNKGPKLKKAIVVKPISKFGVPLLATPLSSSVAVPKGPAQKVNYTRLAVNKHKVEIQTTN